MIHLHKSDREYESSRDRVCFDNMLAQELSLIIIIIIGFSVDHVKSTVIQSYTHMQNHKLSSNELINQSTTQ